MTLLAAQLQHTALVQSKYHSVEGELNHCTAIKKPIGDTEMKLQYVRFTICIPTMGQKKNQNKKHLKAYKVISIGSTWLSRDTPPRRPDC